MIDVSLVILGGIFLLNMVVMVWSMRKLDRLDAEHARRSARLEALAQLMMRLEREAPREQ